MLPNTNAHNFDTSDTSSHKLVFVLLSALIYNNIKHIENFSGDFTF